MHAGSTSHAARWVIVGGGASGLAAAFFLRRLGLPSVVLERDGMPGGRMGTLRLGDRTFDAGGKNIGRRYTLFRQFAASLGEHPFDYFGLNSSQAVDGTIRTFDGRRRWSTLVALARGLAARDLLRFGTLLWRVNADPNAGYLGSALSRRLATRFDDRPASEHFSVEFCRRLLRPMSLRMNGAEPDEVYVGNLGSNVRMILDSYEQFRNGLAPVLEEVQRQYEVRLQTRAESLLIERGRVCGVRAATADGRTADVRGAGVILATPADAAAALIQPIAPTLAERLRTVAYYPVTLILAEYDRPIFSSNVRAIVFGDDEPISNAGAYGIDQLHVVRYTFSGRRGRAAIDTDIDGERLLRAGEEALARYVPCAAAWRRRFVVRHFRPGLCAYAPYHGRLLDQIARDLDAVPGLHLTGDYVQGASIEACFRAASACVHRIAALQQQTAPGTRPAATAAATVTGAFR